MSNAPSNPDYPKAKREVTNVPIQRLEKFGPLYLRVTLGAAFLSAVADRFGLWGKRGAWGNFANFEQYTAQVNSFMPAFTIPFLAWAATAAELSLGIGLILGVWRRWVAFGTAGLLFLFGTAMAISFGIKSPLDYSVYSASAGALLLSLHLPDRAQKEDEENNHM
jgi:putative oxidoreductase